MRPATRNPVVIIALLASLMLIGATPLAAAWIADGTALAPLPPAADSASPAAHQHLDGSVVVAWTDYRSGFADVYAQRIGSHGSPLWSPGGVPVCSFSNTQVNPVICRGSEGPFDRGAIIAWEDGRNGSKDIYAQRLDTSGSALWQADGRPVCTGVADAYSPVIIPESPSGCIVAWIDERDGHPGIYAQKLDGNGSPLWDTNGVPLWTNDRNYTVTDLAMVSDLAGGEIISASLNEVYDDGVCILSYLCVRVDGAGARLWENRGGHYSADNSSLLYSHSSSLSPDGAGGAFITWARSTDHWSEVDSDRLSATGVELWTTNIEGEDTVDRQAWAGRPATARGAEGSLFITWRHDSIRAQKLDANGVPQWGTGVQALPPTAGALRLALDTASDIALIGTGMRAQALAGDGSLVWPASGVIINAAPGTHALAEVSLGVGGTLFACWTDGRYDPNLEVYAQKVGGDGSCLWGPDGVSVSPGDNQEVPWLAPDGLGGGIAVWQDERGEGLNIMAQRLDGAGNTLWPSTGAAVCDQLATQAAPVAVPDAAGGVIVAWTDYRAAGADIYAQRLDSSGAAQWAYDGVVVCDAWDRQESATAVADGGGGAIVAWLDYRNGGVDIYAQRLSAQGPQWTDDGVAVTLSATAESNVRLVADGAGGAILVWEDLRSGTAKVYAQRLSATGLPLWPSGAPAVGGRPVCSYAGAQSAPTLCPDGYQGAIIAWQDGRSATPALFAQRVDGAGDLVWPADGMPMTLVSAYAQRSPLACQDGGGGAIIAWNDYRDGRCDIFAQRVSGGGAKLWGDAGVGVCSTGSLEASGVLVPDYVGGMSAAWVAENGTTGQDIYVQGVNSAGTPAWSAPGLLICDASGDQHSLRGESDGSGGALFVWTDERSGGRQVFAHRHQNALCRVTPEILAFGTVAVGSVVAHEFVIENVGSTEFTGEVTTSCEAFTVISGAGPYVLGPGQSRAVSIAFQPAAAGSYSCTIQTGSGACAGISCTGTGSDLSWAGLQGPATVSAQTHSPTPGIYGRARIVGVTELAGATEGLVAQLGYGPPDSLPYGAGGAEGWTWIEAAWHADNDGCDEFMGALTVHLAGEYDYCYRFSLNGSPWVYGDLDGSANGYSPSQAGLATITTVDVARLDTASAETELGNTALILGRIHIEGVTGELNVPDLHGQVGFGPRGSDPRASPEAWHWSDANRFDIVYEGGSYHHLYEGGVTPPLTGEYAICCRFSYLDWPWLYGDLDGSLNGYSSTQEGVLTVHGAFNSAWTGYAGILFSGVEWGDYDGDGDLDILAGSLLWRNDGWGVFTAVATGMTGGMLGSSSWGDLDGDGDLDVVLTGDSGTEVALYRNDGGDVFTRMPSGMPALTMGSLAALADCDNDGDLDLLLSGASGGSRVSNLYINQGSWNFTSVATGLPGVSDAAAAWGDYDGDGDLDLILTGYTGSAAFTGLYRNDGGGSFAVVETDLPTVYSSGVAWGDYDGDGDLDILLAGNDGVQSLARVYRNNGAGSFSNIGAALPASTRAVGWGDYDNDGDLDLLLVSPLGVYRNDGAGAFQLVDAQFAGAYYSGQWGDSDNDGDLDILLSTFPEGYPRLYQNNGLAFNTPPAPPQNATASVLAGSLTLSWDAASDEQTPASGLSYQLRLGLTPGGNEILPALADATGYRRVARMGSAQLRESWTVTLPSTWDAIYWSVQAVDGAYAGSAFAAEQVVTREFTDVTSGPLGDVGNARGVAWGDYDSDGNQDLYLANGGQGNRLFHNEGNGTFVDATAGPLGDSANNAGVAWGDYDNDGDLDLVMANWDGTGVDILRNDGGGVFSDVLDEPSWVGATGVAWGDFDNDGDLDFYAAAENQSNRLFRNDGSDVFTNVATGAIADPEFGIGVSWGDYDNDGDLDLFLAKSWTGTSKLFRNDGGGTFADATSAPIAGLDGMAPVWGDYDNDGDLDLFLSRWGQPSKLFRNEGAGAFVDATTGPLGVAVWGRSAAWGDYDNDGDLDLCWVNWWGQAIRLFRNDGGGAFTEMTSAPLGGADSGSAVAWADYDNDGDLDLYLGNDGTANKLFRNNVGTLNHWLQVKLVGTQSNRSGIGARVIVVGGGKRQIREVSGGSGLFSQDSLVQQFGLGAAMAVDSLIVRWPSGVRQVVLPAPAVNTMVTVTEDSAAFTAVDAGLPGVHWGCAAVWGDYVNDGYLDILLTGWGEGGALTGVYANVGGTGTFVDIGAGLPPLRFSTGAWGDCDGDGDLDLLLAGDTGAGYASNVYRNDAGVFTNMNAGLVGVRYGAAAWGDHDNDGDLDILLMGDTGGGPLTRVYRNDGAGVFTDSGAGLVGLYTGSVAWGDYDRDGDLDVLLTGAMSMGRTSRVYRNDGGGAFTDIGAGLPGVNWSSAAWGDYDSDGDLDILLTGESDSGYLARVYRNEGNGTFTDIGANLPGVVGSSAGWGDYDNDGQLDILLTGSTGAAYISRVYRNGGAGVFTGIGANLAGVWVGSAAWGDYDRDGDLDILLSGDTGAGLTTRIYENNVALANTVPTAPTGLAFHMSGNRLTMNWNAATDSETPAAGLSYNVRLGLVPGGGAIMPALADPASGLRRVAALGNAQQRTAWTVTLPPLPGPYYWSVQAIDGAFAGGPFAPEQSLSLPTAVEDDPVPTEFALRPNMPNPFNPATVIEFNLPHGEAVRLSIYDLKGRRVRCLVDEVKPAGSYRILWNGTDDRGQPLASGVYVCRMEAGSFRETRRMTLVK